jgi:hypothetical protein
MKAVLKFRRHLEWRSAVPIQSLGHIHRQIVAAAKQALQRLFDNDRLLIPFPVRVVNPRRFDRSRSRD